MKVAHLSEPAEERVVFRDGLGVREWRETGTGERVEWCHLDPAFAAVEVPLKERVSRLAKFQHVKFTRILSLEPARKGKGPILVSSHVAGTRLGEVLEMAGHGLLAFDAAAALQVTREVLGALAVLHDSRNVTHGALAPERVVLTPTGRVVMTEHVLAQGLDRLQAPRHQLWRDWRIATPPGPGTIRFDIKTDLAQLGLLALAAILGRPIEEEDYPHRLRGLLLPAQDRLTRSPAAPIAAELSTWLERLMPIETRRPFATVREAQQAFETLVSPKATAIGLAPARVKGVLTAIASLSPQTAAPADQGSSESGAVPPEPTLSTVVVATAPPADDIDIEALLRLEAELEGGSAPMAAPALAAVMADAPSPVDVVESPVVTTDSVDLPQVTTVPADVPMGALAEERLELERQLAALVEAVAPDPAETVRLIPETPATAEPLVDARVRWSSMPAADVVARSAAEETSGVGETTTPAADDPPYDATPFVFEPMVLRLPEEPAPAAALEHVPSDWWREALPWRDETATATADVAPAETFITEADADADADADTDTALPADAVALDESPLPAELAVDAEADVIETSVPGAVEMPVDAAGVDVEVPEAPVVVADALHVIAEDAIAETPAETCTIVDTAAPVPEPVLDDTVATAALADADETAPAGALFQDTDAAVADVTTMAAVVVVEDAPGPVVAEAVGPMASAEAEATSDEPEALTHPAPSAFDLPDRVFEAEAVDDACPAVLPEIAAEVVATTLSEPPHVGLVEPALLEAVAEFPSHTVVALDEQPTTAPDTWTGSTVGDGFDVEASDAEQAPPTWLDESVEVAPVEAVDGPAPLTWLAVPEASDPLVADEPTDATSDSPATAIHEVVVFASSDAAAVVETVGALPTSANVEVPSFLPADETRAEALVVQAADAAPQVGWFSRDQVPVDAAPESAIPLATGGFRAFGAVNDDASVEAPSADDGPMLRTSFAFAETDAPPAATQSFAGFVSSEPLDSPAEVPEPIDAVVLDPVVMHPDVVATPNDTDVVNAPAALIEADRQHETDARTETAVESELLAPPRSEPVEDTPAWAPEIEVTEGQVSDLAFDTNEAERVAVAAPQSAAPDAPTPELLPEVVPEVVIVDGGQDGEAWDHLPSELPATTPSSGETDPSSAATRGATASDEAASEDEDDEVETTVTSAVAGASSIPSKKKRRRNRRRKGQLAAPVVAASPVTPPPAPVVTVAQAAVEAPVLATPEPLESDVADEPWLPTRRSLLDREVPTWTPSEPLEMRVRPLLRRPEPVEEAPRDAEDVLAAQAAVREAAPVTAPAAIASVGAAMPPPVESVVTHEPEIKAVGMPDLEDMRPTGRAAVMSMADAIGPGVSSRSGAVERPHALAAPVPDSKSWNWRRIIAASVIFALCNGGVFAAWWWVQPGTYGTLVVQTAQSGVEVLIDGKAVGRTPFRDDVAPGRHTLMLRHNGQVREMPVEITLGVVTTQALEWPVPEGGARGHLQITSTPTGAKVYLNGELKGEAPLLLEDLPAGKQELTLRGDAGTVTVAATVVGGETTPLEVPIFAGWVLVDAPVEMNLLLRGSKIGSTMDGQILLSPGRHQIEAVSDALGYRRTLVVTIEPGEVKRVAVIVPPAPLQVQDEPGSEVFVDGDRVGSLPSALTIPLGTHDVLVRRPDGSERRQTLTVRAGTTATM